MRAWLACLIVALMVALPVGAAETYDLIFKTGTLSDLSADQVLEYERETLISADEAYAARQSGKVSLSLESDENALLRFHQGEKARALGTFPATVGNPIVMYFVETVLRDVANQAGGSPFYIRNRIKASLVAFAEIEETTVAFDGDEIAAQSITLRPFLKDKNRDRMKGYGDLTLTFTMSEDVPGWYNSLVANVAGADENAPIYRNAIVLHKEGASK